MMNESEYRIYVDDVINSQGFFVSNEFGSKVPCGIRKVNLHDDDGAVIQKAEAAARFAIEKYNENENANLVFQAILNLNVQPTAGRIYYITMAVAAKSSETVSCRGGLFCYQAKVWEKIHGGYRVDIFRVAPSHVASSS